MHTPVVTVAAITLLTTLADLSAQDQLPIQLGDIVKVNHACITWMIQGGPTYSDCQTLRATVVSLSADSIVLYADHGQERFALPLTALGGVERWKGSGSNAGRGAWIGFGFGFAGGAMAAGAAAASSQMIDDAAAQFAVVGGLVCGLLGTMVGAVVGELATDRWEEVPLDQLRVQPVATTDGFGLAASVRF